MRSTDLWPWPDDIKPEPVALPAVGSIAVRRVRNGVMRGVVTAHRGERIEVEFPHGDRRMICAPFVGIEFQKPEKVATVPRGAINAALVGLG